jgi:hypothetical protein
MIHVGNGVVEFRSQNKITTLYTITPFCPFQLAETKEKSILEIIYIKRVEFLKSGVDFVFFSQQQCANPHSKLQETYFE